ncbi:MAG: DUF5721 family protein [bacterium]|nr:DUF5721 family protein [bacterium]
MVALRIMDVKGFMAKLLMESGTVFDTFLLSEAVITTYNTFTIDGHIHSEFYASDDDIEGNHDGISDGEVMSTWKAMKPICFDLIKGKRTPLNFKFVFCLSPENVEKFLTQAGLSEAFRSENINGLVLNIKYDGSALTCISATSLNLFTLDKSLEHAWDDMIRRFFSQNAIAFEES